MRASARILLLCVLIAAVACSKKEPPAGPEPTGDDTAADNESGGEKEAVVTAGNATILGAALPRDVITKFVDRQKASILLCYKRAVQRNPTLAGKMVVEFTVSPTGKVIKPRKTSSTLNDATVEQCVVERLARWRFPEPKGGEALTVTYPFRFETR